ncbi:DUF2267 domain-containing protein [Geobacter sp. DSM 9736]|uniref:DUF2267 domain-containing protein n=1 Tax=Geobacter sp. DSM 9736 TaxID=1277350 RepID=UPI000B5058C5|nr:DUF2267 domain-containing protein [Geobacter sp. DSM 9736]SNB45995.1 Uncharacterized conserved protein, DUF2267 family [Geobacter sp. DSM 9736]
MKYDQFIKEVQMKIGFGSKDAALIATQATLQTLGERLDEGEKKDVASQLPRELGQYLKQSDRRYEFGLDEFVERVARREGTEPNVAKSHVKGVIGVLHKAVSDGEWDDILSQLPADMKQFFA